MAKVSFKRCYSSETGKRSGTNLLLFFLFTALACPEGEVVAQQLPVESQDSIAAGSAVKRRRILSEDLKLRT